MPTATAMAMAIEIGICVERLRACKDRPAREVRAERRLRARLARLLGPRLREIRDEAADGVPEAEDARRSLLAKLEELEGGVVEAISPEAMEAAERGRRRVERTVARARPESAEKALRPDKMREVVAGVGARALRRVVDRVRGTLDEAAGADDPGKLLGETVDSVLGFELGRMSRSVIASSERVAEFETERELGVRYHMWTTAGDDQVREHHAELDGQVARVGAPFSNGLRYPASAGCRCMLEPWFPPEGFTPPVGDWFYP